MTAALQVEALRVRLAGLPVLHGIDVAFSKGEFVAVIGPNGAGKSTFLRAAAGLVPAQGRILLAGRELGNLSRRDRARAIAYLQQAGRAHWPICVRDLVALGRIPHAGYGSALAPKDREAIAAALAACDLESVAERPCSEISGGELARALLARALAVGASLLLVDEPVAALDPAHQLRAMDLLREEARRGTTVLAVMHDLSLAARFADRFLAFDEGRVAADGTPGDLIAASVLDRIFGVRFVATPVEGATTALSALPIPADPNQSMLGSTRSGGR